MRTCKYISVALVLALMGCVSPSLYEDIHLSSLKQGNRNHELIQELEAKQSRGERLGSFRLLLLGAAYYDIKRYDKLLATADLMEQSIAAGDREFMGIGDLTVYPHLFRAGAALDMGDYDKTIKEASAAYDLLQRPGQQAQSFYRQQLITTLGALGIAHALQGRTDEASKALEQLRPINVSDTNLGPEKHIAMARICMAGRQFDQALAAVTDPAAGVPAHLTMFYDPTFQEVPKFFIRTKSLYETGHAQEARQSYDKLLEHPQIQQMGEIYWLALLDRSRIDQADQKTTEAMDLLKRAADVVEAQRSSIDTETGRIGFVGDKQAIYEDLVSLSLDQGHDAEAFEYAERAKARALVDLLASQKEIVAPTEETTQVCTLVNNMAKAESELAMLPDPNHTEGAAQTRGVFVSVRNNLIAEAPEVASIVTVTNTPAAEIQNLLAPEETLIEYYYTDRDLFAFVLTRDSIRAVKLYRAGIEQAVNEFRAAIANPATNDCALWSQKLYQQLVKPLSSLLHTDQLIIVPHGFLHYLPFDALRSGEEYLVDRYSIRILPSASVLKFLKRREATGEAKVLILGNPDVGDPKFDLPFAQEEAVSVSKRLKNAKVLLRGDATETFVKTEGGQFRILHFATHGIFDMAKPLNSALLLAKDEANDGILRVGELYTLRLNADLVTLSACDTALGKVANGDDVVGFTRGLLYAGTSSVVSSLWKVDDRATRLLMERFYENWMRGLPKIIALRQAKLWLKNYEEDVVDPEASSAQGRDVKVRKKPYAHPYFWAAFLLTGNAQ